MIRLSKTIPTALHAAPTPYNVPERHLRQCGAWKDANGDATRVLGLEEARSRLGFSEFADIGDLSIDDAHADFWQHGQARGTPNVRSERVRELGITRKLIEEDHPLMERMRRWLESDYQTRTAMVLRTVAGLPPNLHTAYDRLASRVEELHVKSGSTALTRFFFNALDALMHCQDMRCLPPEVQKTCEHARMLKSDHTRRSNCMVAESGNANLTVPHHYSMYMAVVMELQRKFGNPFRLRLRKALAQPSPCDAFESHEFREEWQKYTCLLAAVMIMENCQRPEIMYKLHYEQVEKAEEGEEDLLLVHFPQNKSKRAQQIVFVPSTLMGQLKEYIKIRNLLWERWISMEVRHAACDTQVGPMLDLSRIPEDVMMVAPLQEHHAKTALSIVCTVLEWNRRR